MVYSDEHNRFIQGIHTMRTKTKYIHVNQHVIRANKKHNKNDPCITIKQGSKNTYCHEVEVLGPSKIIFFTNNFFIKLIKS